MLRVNQEILTFLKQVKNRKSSSWKSTDLTKVFNLLIFLTSVIKFSSLMNIWSLKDIVEISATAEIFVITKNKGETTEKPTKTNRKETLLASFCPLSVNINNAQ